MKRISLNSNGIANMTAVSNTFIDTYMPSADGSYVKVYLYLLRCLGQPSIDITISHIADILECTERDVVRALCYWERANLLVLVREGEDITSIALNNPECDNSCIRSTINHSNHNNHNNGSGDNNQNNALAVSNISSPIVSSTINSNVNTNKEPDNQPADIAMLISPPLEVLMENDNFADMISVIEASYVKRPLSPKEGEFIADLYCKFQFGTCLIFDLFDQCSDKIDSKTSFIPYMSKVASSWYSKGIDSSLKAREYSREYLECYTALRKAFGINNRDLSSAELKFINKWHADNGFSPDMIQLACEKCIASIGKPSLNYTDSVMEAWRRNNIRTIQDVNKSDQSYQSSKSNTPKAAKPNFYNTYTQRDYTDDDFAKLELELLSR